MKKRAATTSSPRQSGALRFRGRNLTPPATRHRSASGATSKRGSQRGGSAKMTVDHDQIRHWVESRGGHPATVKRTAGRGQTAGIIRIDFPGYSGQQTLKPISWDEWFGMFEDHKLAFLYQDKTATGKQSRFNKLVRREE